MSDCNCPIGKLNEPINLQLPIGGEKLVISGKFYKASTGSAGVEKFLAIHRECD